MTANSLKEAADRFVSTALASTADQVDEATKDTLIQLIENVLSEVTKVPYHQPTVVPTKTEPATETGSASKPSSFPTCPKGGRLVGLFLFGLSFANARCIVCGKTFRQISPDPLDQGKSILPNQPFYGCVCCRDMTWCRTCYRRLQITIDARSKQGERNYQHGRNHDSYRVWPSNMDQATARAFAILRDKEQVCLMLFTLAQTLYTDQAVTDKSTLRQELIAAMDIHKENNQLFLAASGTLKEALPNDTDVTLAEATKMCDIVKGYLCTFPAVASEGILAASLGLVRAILDSSQSARRGLLVQLPGLFDMVLKMISDSSSSDQVLQEAISVFARIVGRAKQQDHLRMMKQAMNRIGPREEGRRRIYEACLSMFDANDPDELVSAIRFLASAETTD